MMFTPSSLTMPTQSSKMRSVSDSALNTDKVTSFFPGNKNEKVAFAVLQPKRRISFDERVMVREYSSKSWNLVHDSQQVSPIPSTRRVIQSIPGIIVCSPDRSQQRAIEQRQNGHTSLTPILLPRCPSSPLSTGNISVNLSDAMATTRSRGTCSFDILLLREIQNILIVDPHDIFLALFSRRLEEAMQHSVNIVTAHSSEEALNLCSKQSFDVIFTEERLSLFHRHTSGTKVTSGSALLGHLREHAPKEFQNTLMIGISAHWQSDRATLAKSGADFCWSKVPPPVLNQNMLEELLYALLSKRGKDEDAKALTSICSSGEEQASLLAENL